MHRYTRGFQQRFHQPLGVRRILDLVQLNRILSWSGNLGRLELEHSNNARVVIRKLTTKPHQQNIPPLL